MLQKGYTISFYKGSLSVLVVVVMLALSFSCAGKKKEFGAAITDRDSLPIVSTYGVTTYISDSGITRYRIDTEEWLIFDKKQPSYWSFEKGVYLEKFDTVFQVEASIKADTAYFYDKEKLWKLIGHIEIKNLKGEKFNTELLYWDQDKGKVYSDRFIRIEQPDRIIIGHGFDSNQQMTDYTIHNMEGIFYVSNDATASPITTSTDSVLTDSKKP